MKLFTDFGARAGSRAKTMSPLSVAMVASYLTDGSITCAGAEYCFFCIGRVYRDGASRPARWGATHRKEWEGGYGRPNAGGETAPGRVCRGAPSPHGDPRGADAPRRR